MKRSISTLLSFIALAVALFYGVITVAAFERNESDWGLLSAFRGLFISLTIGSVLVVLFSIGAFIRKERMAVFSLLISIPSFCFMLWVGSGYIRNERVQTRERVEEDLVKAHRESLLSDDGVLNVGRWPNDDSPKGWALRSVLWESQGEFSEVDFLGLAARDPSWVETMFYHHDCPASLLREGFIAYKARSKRSPLSASFSQILKNPNSPTYFVEEVSTWADLSEVDRWSVERILDARLMNQKKQNKSEMATPRNPSD